MLDFFSDHPGRLYVVAAMLPLLPAVLMLLAATVKNLARPAAARGGFAAWVYRILGGDRPQVWGAYLSVGCMAVVTFQGVAGLAPFLTTDFGALGFEPSFPSVVWPPGSHEAYAIDSYNRSEPQLAEKTEWVRLGSESAREVEHTEIRNLHIINPANPVGPSVTTKNDTKTTTTWEPPPSTSVFLGYSIDILAALLFAMVAVVATLVFVFSLGYLADERHEKTEDHEAHAERRGRIELFFVYLSLFVSAMLNLLIADNLLQLFICWELVGVCSFLLVGFYSERPAATTAATKAFIVNRIGDVGFLIAIAVAWSMAGTLTINELHIGYTPGVTASGLEILLGLGLFLGCVGKSAQIPLQTWLPDAMAGPTPVSALIHAATMVAAGVYLAVRCRWLFTPEVYLVIAYTGCVTMFLGATAACFQNDIKRVLAYSTISQLGFMMLGVGVVGEYGPSDAAFHLFTHAFFKALLFLAAGSVIYSLHHEQDIRQMGGLWRRMPTTAFTMLVGVLAISGFPLLSGWYSKETILTDAVYAVAFRPEHAALVVLPFLVAGMTAFYMFRLWFLVFTGTPRNPEAFDHVHESPPVMTVPLLILAAISVCAGWGWPVWDSDASYVNNLLRDRLSIAHVIHWIGATEDYDTHMYRAQHIIEHYHLLIEATAGFVALLGFGFAYWRYVARGVVPAEPRGFQSFFANAWYFDAAYRVLFVRPAVRLAFALASTDKRPGAADGAGSDPGAKRFDPGTLDGWLNAVGQAAAAGGAALRRVQTGYVRGYVLALGLTVVGVLGMLAVLNR